MGDLTPKVDGILKKMKVVLESHMKLEDDNARLMDERAKLQQQLSAQNEQVKVLENKLSFLKASKGMALAGGESKNLKNKINEYIREIDKCIGMLNN